MDVKKEVETVAKKTIYGFDVKSYMTRSLYDLGLDSLDKFGLVANVEDACNVLMPARLIERIDTVEGIVVSVENLKRVKKINDTWVPCALNADSRCAYMSEVPDNAVCRSTIAPRLDFCKTIACHLYAGKQK
jgi:acyl carrier protein